MDALHIAASPEYLQGISDERQRIIAELEDAEGDFLGCNCLSCKDIAKHIRWTVIRIKASAK
jgi:hypothetical protein